MSEHSKLFAETVTITLRKDEALVLFEMLANATDAASIPIRDDSERRAIWNLAALFEKTLVEPFMKDYREIVNEAKRRICGNSN